MHSSCSIINRCRKCECTRLKPSRLSDVWSSDLERGMKSMCLSLGTAMRTDLDMQTLYITVDMLCISAVLALFHTSISPLSPLYSDVKKEKKKKTKNQLMFVFSVFIRVGCCSGVHF